MKKIFGVLALCLGLTVLSAADSKGNDWFIGGNVGFQNSQVSLQSDKLKDLNVNLGVDVGYLINDEWRTYVGYKITTKGKDVLAYNVDAKISKQHQIHVGLDYTPKFIGDARALMGVYTGWKFAKIEEGTITNNTNGFVLGARAGFLIGITDNVETGILVNVDKTWNKKGDFKASQVNYGTSVLVNYKF